MYIPKRYGQSKVEKCPFCGDTATTTNSQGVSVCRAHNKAVMNEMKCVCGSWLEMRQGKWGTYFSCISCGNMNLKKVLELNEIKDVSDAGTKKKENPDSEPTLIKKKLKELPAGERPVQVVRSDDPRYFD